MIETGVFMFLTRTFCWKSLSSLGLLVALSACSGAQIAAKPDGVVLAPRAAAVLQTLNLAILEEPAGENCEFGGVKVLAWQEKGGSDTAYDEGVDTLSSEKYKCGTAEKKWVEVGACSGAAVVGCVTTETYKSYASCASDGTVDCAANSSFKAVDASKLVGGNIKAGVTIAGTTGAYPSALYPLTGADSTSDLPLFASTVGGTTYEWFTADGTRLTSAVLADQNVTPSTTAQAFDVGLYRSVTVAGDADFVAGNIATGVQIFNVTGTSSIRPADCAADGATNCVSVAGFTAADTTGLAAKILSTNTVAGVPGTYVPPTVLNVKSGVTYGVAGALTGTYPSSGNELTGSSGTDLPSLASTVAAGTYQFFKSDGTRVTGSITDAGSITPTGSLQNYTTSLYKGFSVAAASLESHSTCTADAQTGCVTDASYKAAKMSEFDGSKILLNTTIAGVAGNVTVPAATDVRLSTTFGSSLGSTGSLVAESHSACSADGVGAAGSCYTTDAYKSAKMSDFDTWSIVAGKTIAGVAGSAYVGSLLSSGAHHDMNATPGNMTYAQELGLGASTLWRTITTSGNTGYGYREVPLIAKDDDGYTASTNPVTKLTRPTVATWGGSGSGVRKVCGKAATSVATKITNCGTNNPTAATWNGVVKGISGEGSWTLVTVYSGTLADGATCDATCYEVWRDNRTGLLWSDRLEDSVGAGTNYYWCHASGSSNSANVNASYREVDPSGYCSGGTYQNQTNPVSLCFEDTGFTTSTNLDPMKGNMHKHSGSATVKWRLPTKYDFEVAEHNGIRHVLPNMATWFWSASVNSDSRISAWLFNGNNGYVDPDPRTNTFGVRCVGGE
jgi:hypothetical protein